MKMKREKGNVFYENSNLENKLVGAAWNDLPVSFLPFRAEEDEGEDEGAKTMMDESEE